MDLVMILNHILKFLLSLYANPNLPRKIVQDFVNYMKEFLNDMYIPSLKNDIINILKDENLTKTSSEKLEKCFQEYASIFNSVETERRRFELLKRIGLTGFDEYVIGKTLKTQSVGNQSL